MTVSESKTRYILILFSFRYLEVHKLSFSVVVARVTTHHSAFSSVFLLSGIDIIRQWSLAGTRKDGCDTGYPMNRANTTITPSDCAGLHNVPCRHDHEPFIAKHVFSASRPRTASPTTAPMTDHSPPRLELPYADLHAPAHREPHIDSEEAVQYERRRVSRELHPIYPSDSSRQSVEEPHASQSNASLRSRNASLYTASTADERLWSRALGLDDGRSSRYQRRCCPQHQVICTRTPVARSLHQILVHTYQHND
jgi:hypothetical protein